jgi:hypothetical protein
MAGVQKDVEDSIKPLIYDTQLSLAKEQGLEFPNFGRIQLIKLRNDQVFLFLFQCSIFLFTNFFTIGLAHGHTLTWSVDKPVVFRRRQDRGNS